MGYWFARHVSNTILFAVLITALIAIIHRYSGTLALAFGIVAVAALAFDRFVENAHLRSLERR